MSNVHRLLWHSSHREGMNRQAPEFSPLCHDGRCSCAAGFVNHIDLPQVGVRISKSPFCNSGEKSIRAGAKSNIGDPGGRGAVPR
jgi:hypothetical protein